MRVLLVVLRVKISRSERIASSEGDRAMVVCDCEALAKFPGEQKLPSIVLGYFSLLILGNRRETFHYCTSHLVESEMMIKKIGMAQSNLNKCHFFLCFRNQYDKTWKYYYRYDLFDYISVVESDVLVEKMKCIFVVVLEELDWWQATGSCP